MMHHDIKVAWSEDLLIWYNLSMVDGILSNNNDNNKHLWSIKSHSLSFHSFVLNTILPRHPLLQCAYCGESSFQSLDLKSL